MSNAEYYTYGDIKLERGKFDLPPILIGTIFYQNETLLIGKILNSLTLKKQLNALKNIYPYQNNIRFLI
ncbi:MAG: hypothetical protein ACFFAV_11620 [Candidatus Hermodarchaeota archaeon]